ncbi:hypothetical protein DRF65_08530 [Chryseobacterium pennae]|uniref:Uncharacterized protein n=1 Tax=Chryseobacterium pennae TaxID=2258962 RepID=A0A3D9CAV8_9FLAO|nr:hypothetical protein [Chryseobacterium pennae]REC62858.1 hypothetical protein DRF65_08530 [Chryseobacterium pennae]
MKQRILILSFTLSTLLCFGQKGYLELSENFDKYKGSLREYYNDIFPKLYKDFSQQSYARYTSIPSFSEEYAFSVETIDNRYYIISNRFSENFWYAKKRNQVKLISHKTEIDSTLYLKIGNLFQILTQQMKTSEKEKRGFDGTMFYFATTDTTGQMKTGETWSPNDNTVLDRIVKVCNRLFSIDKEKNSSHSDIVKEIEKLIEEIKK